MCRRCGGTQFVPRKVDLRPIPTHRGRQGSEWVSRRLNGAAPESNRPTGVLTYGSRVTYAFTGAGRHGVTCDSLSRSGRAAARVLRRWRRPRRFGVALRDRHASGSVLERPAYPPRDGTRHELLPSRVLPASWLRCLRVGGLRADDGAAGRRCPGRNGRGRNAQGHACRDKGDVRTRSARRSPSARAGEQARARQSACARSRLEQHRASRLDGR